MGLAYGASLLGRIHPVIIHRCEKRKCSFVIRPQRPLFDSTNGQDYSIPQNGSLGVGEVQTGEERVRERERDERV